VENFDADRYLVDQLIRPIANLYRITPLAAGGARFETDTVLRVDGNGRIGQLGGDADEDAIDLRPMLLLPGMVDLHAHLPQLPNAGLGAGLWGGVDELRPLIRRGARYEPSASAASAERRGEWELAVRRARLR